MDTFGTGRSTTSMIGSIRIGVAHFSGPIVADLVNKFGYREIVISGSIITATSLIVSGMALNIATLTVTAGFMTGRKQINFKFLQMIILSPVNAYFHIFSRIWFLPHYATIDHKHTRLL